MRSNRARLLFVIGSLAALLSLRAVSSPSGSGRDPATRALSIFSDVFSLTRQNYVEPTESKALLDGAYDGMSDALDPFSYYVSASDRAAYRAQESSGAVGPGIVIARRGGFPYIVAPLPGSPAEKAGIHAGDLLDTVDGKPVRNASLWKVKAALEGPEGSHVEVTVFRGGDEKRVSLSIPRSRFEAPPVSTTWERDVAIVKVPAFTRATADGIRQAIEEANRRNVQRMIVDVRGSVAGDLALATAPAALFTGKGVVAKAVGRRVTLPSLEAAGDRIWKGRTVVLTDDSTAGAAEIFAAALHDRSEAITVGETTVGMAIVQRPVPTQSGGTLYMTVARYVSPSGKALAGKGVVPDDRVITFPGETAGKDAILERGLEVARGSNPGRRAA
jgi:carboxyl-terminal processing protease